MLARMATTKAQRLPLKVKLGFGVGDVGGNLFYTLIQFYMLFYFTDVMRLGPALAGTAFLVGKIVDAFNDPLIGFWSDRTRSRWGQEAAVDLLGGDRHPPFDRS